MMLSTENGRPKMLRWRIKGNLLLVRLPLAISMFDLVLPAPTLPVAHHISQWATREVPA
jgi:hypothetical protein